MVLSALKISSYDITSVVYEGANTIVYRGVSKPKQSKAILKALRAEFPTLEQIASLKYEYFITKNLNLEGVVRVLSLENHQNRPILVKEDFGGISLKQFLCKEKIKLQTFLSIAVQLAQSLVSLQAHHIIHKDIKPGNIIIDPQSTEVRLTDFSIASRLGTEIPQLTNPNQLEGTLAYMSPEQTGRMNRIVDYRSDFYSLGITFYEMLTGQLPFNSDDPMELVYCHIAKQPTSIQQLCPDIPPSVAAIVMKLMAKNAEDRYQSATGLLADLEFCLDNFKNTGDIPNFTPGLSDRAAQLTIPQKLYGREEEVSTLLSAFDRISQGTREMILVSGYSGVGKSSLVAEVHKPIVSHRGYFISGKFDQLERNVPCASIIQALQSLMRQLLTESSEQLQTWKEKLLAALGNNGQIIIDVIPELELVIGKQPPVAEVGITESISRFNRTFLGFIQVFAQPEHPLVIFLDDLQWADSASLKLLQVLMVNPVSQYLLLIGAYRDNEVYPTHPLMKTLEEITSFGAAINNIVLRPLDIAHVQQFLVDTFLVVASPHVTSLRDLSEVLFNTTQGNPFFLTQLLKTLHQEKLLTFDFTTGQWSFNIDDIKHALITEKTAVDLVVNNIEKLPEATQALLKLAACVGARFSLNLLATASEKTLLDVAQALQPALQQGLILPLDNEYKVALLFAESELEAFEFDDSKLKFLHDKVQQATYSLIPQEQKQATHLKIGRSLLQSTPSNQLEANIFDIVNQLNIGIDRIDRNSQREELSKLNLVAGKRAKNAAAYELAAKYLETGLELLPSDCWQNQYDLTLNLYLEAAEAQYLSANFERSLELGDAIVSQAKTLLDQIKAYKLKIEIYIVQVQMETALSLGLSVIDMLGVKLLESPPQIEDIEALINLPQMTDPYKIATVWFFFRLLDVAYISNPKLWAPMLFTMVNLCLKYGNSPVAANIYGFYALFLCGSLNDIDAGYRYGLLSLKLLDRLNTSSLQTTVLGAFNGYVRFWKEHIRSSLNPLLLAYESGLASGEIVNGGYAIINYCINSFFAGNTIELIEQKYKYYIDELKKQRLDYHLVFAQIGGQLMLNLLNRNEEITQLVGSTLNELEIIPNLIEQKNGTALFYIYLVKAILHYLFNQPELAIANIEAAECYKQSVSGMFMNAQQNFYQSLAILACYSRTETKQQEQYLDRVTVNQKILQQWAEHAPMNFQHKYDLVEAERLRVLGEKCQAMDYYDLAIQGAADNGYIHEQALANERAAEFYLSLGKEKIAFVYMTEAYYGYIRWGAIAKVKDLESRYPYLTLRTLQPTSHITLTNTSSTCSKSPSLDALTVTKASQALSSEIVLERLLERLIHLVKESAGAEKVLFIAPQGNKLMIEASLVSENATVLQSILIRDSKILPISLINYVNKTKKYLLLDDATQAEHFCNDPYITINQPKSILVLPIINLGTIKGILYLENNLATKAFSQSRLEVLQVLTTQAAISLENASFYSTLSARVQERTQQLELNNLQLQNTLKELHRTQTQLIHNEKMSSLGQLVAGIAHEINNPINFIYGNLNYTSEYTNFLLELIEIYQNNYPDELPELLQKFEEVDFDYLREDLLKIINSMRVGAERIRNIVKSLRNFSRLDEAAIKKVDIHEGIESTLMILQQKLGTIEVIKEFGDLPNVTCDASQLNQAFMHVITNAIDAVHEKFICLKPANIQKSITDKPTIWIRTAFDDDNQVEIRIADNGIGMSDDVKNKIFDPFFTTKEVGKGTGLGLSISYQIITEKHRGILEYISSPGEGTEFVIKIPLAPPI